MTTSSPTTQLWFNRGLIWAYSFNHSEAERCFERAAASDPSCAAALWGVAYAAGPNYNKAWQFFDPEDRRASIQKVNDVANHALLLLLKTLGLNGSDIENLSDFLTRYTDEFTTVSLLPPMSLAAFLMTAIVCHMLRFNMA